MAQRTFDRDKPGGGVDFGSFAKKTDPADSFDKQAQSMIKKDRTADLSNFKGAPGFTKDPLASDDENAANYQKFANKQDAKSMGLPDDDDNSATASGRKRPTNEEREDGKKRYGVTRAGKRCVCGTPGCGGQNCTDMSEQMTSPDAPMSVSAKPDFPDVDGDGDTKEPISQAQKQKKEKEGDDPKKKSAKPKKGEVPPQLRKHVEKNKKGQNESKIYTPEQEQSLYESRFNDRNSKIFDKLKKLWTK